MLHAMSQKKNAPSQNLLTPVFGLAFELYRDGDGPKKRNYQDGRSLRSGPFGSVSEPHHIRAARNYTENRQQRMCPAETSNAL